MINILITSLFVFSTAIAHGGPQCTAKPKIDWKKEKDFKQSLTDQGYKIKFFKVTDGNCYEIYGWDKAGKKVEIYFDPVDGRIVKEVRK